MTLAGTTGLRLYLGATMGLSLWLRSTFPASAIADAITDDQLFVKLARNILVGRWLGPYSEYTHVKGVFYSLFIDLSFLSGVPLKIFEQAAYLGAALLFCEVVARLHRRRWAAALLFAFLALNPILFHPELARVVREGVYIPLALGVVALAGGGFLIKHRTRAAQIFWLAALGLAGGAFWLTREEALWLGPALLPLFGSWMYRTRREWRRWIVLAVPIVAFLVPVSAVNIANYVVYGVYRNSDLRSAEVQAAYGAISRIQPDAWQPYVVFPRAARGRAYPVSPAAAELRRYFEGEKAEQWRDIACRAQTASTDCPEILAGWFIWALRDAMAEAGHYRSATDARDYHERLAAEINAACDDGRLACLPARVTLMPPFRAEFVRGTFDAAVRAAWALLRAGGGVVGARPSTGHPENLALFQDMLQGAMTPIAPISKYTETAAGHSVSAFKLRLQITIARLIARAYANAVPALFGIALLALIIAMIRHRPLQRDCGLLALIASCFLAVATRIGLLAYLDATSFPAVNDLYLSPATPFLLGFIGLCLIAATTPRYFRASE